MIKAEFDKLFAQLSSSFEMYMLAHVDWPLLEQITDKEEEALLVFLTEDPDFNAWSLGRAALTRTTDDVPDRPVALYYAPLVQQPSGPQPDWSRGKALGRFILKPAEEKTRVAG